MPMVDSMAVSNWRTSGQWPWSLPRHPYPVVPVSALTDPAQLMGRQLGEVTRRPTICQVLHTLRVGGAEMVAAGLARRLQRAYRFMFVCLDELGTLGEELRSEGFTVEVLNRRPGIDWRAILRLARVLRNERVALLHAHQYTPFFYAALSRQLGSGAPVLFTEHGRHFPDYRRQKRVLANRFLLRRRDRVVAVGNAVRHALVANEGISAKRIAVIHNGIDATAFNDRRCDRNQLRSEIGVAPDDLTLIQVARLDYLKDHATAIRALERVRAQRPDACLVLVGDGPEQAKIEAEVRQRGLSGRVHFLGLRTDVARLVQAADIFLLTSISEGIPLTLIEAMSAGLPVVATRVGGVGEIVAEGQTGLLAPAGDDRGLANQILCLAADPVKRRLMGQLGRERARAVFSEKQMHAHYQRLYEETLNG